jgi:hypothetical protein
MKLVCLMLCASLLLVGCATIKVESPKGQNIVLQPSFESQPVVAKKKVWYALWGLVPINSNSTADMVRDQNLTEMSVATWYGVDDFLISYVLGFVTIGTKSVEIRGK